MLIGMLCVCVDQECEEKPCFCLPGRVGPVCLKTNPADVIFAKCKLRDSLDFKASVALIFIDLNLDKSSTLWCECLLESALVWTQSPLRTTLTTQATIAFEAPAHYILSPIQWRPGQVGRRPSCSVKTITDSVGAQRRNRVVRNPLIAFKHHGGKCTVCWKT